MAVRNHGSSHRLIRSGTAARSAAAGGTNSRVRLTDEVAPSPYALAEPSPAVAQGCSQQTGTAAVVEAARASAFGSRYAALQSRQTPTAVATPRMTSVAEAEYVSLMAALRTSSHQSAATWRVSDLARSAHRPSAEAARATLGGPAMASGDLAARRSCRRRVVRKVATRSPVSAELPMHASRHVRTRSHRYASSCSLALDDEASETT